MFLSPAACEDERSNAWYQWVGAFRGDPRWVCANPPGTDDTPRAVGGHRRIGTRTPGLNARLEPMSEDLVRNRKQNERFVKRVIGGIKAEEEEEEEEQEEKEKDSP